MAGGGYFPRRADARPRAALPPRRAVLFLLALPLLALVGLIAWLLGGGIQQLILFLPGIIALPVFSLTASLGGRGVPLSLPADAAAAARAAAWT